MFQINSRLTDTSPLFKAHFHGLPVIVDLQLMANCCGLQCPFSQSASQKCIKRKIHIDRSKKTHQSWLISREAESSQPSQGYLRAKGATGQRVHMPALQLSYLHTRTCTARARVSGQHMGLGKRSVPRLKAKSQGSSQKDTEGVWGGPIQKEVTEKKQTRKPKNFPS